MTVTKPRAAFRVVAKLEMQPWQYAEGQLTTIFYNTNSGVYFEIWPKYDHEFVFSSGSGKGEKKVSQSLSINVGRALPSSSQLLSTVKAGQGKEDIFGRMGLWTTVHEGPIVALKSDSNPGDRIFLTAETFVYTCQNGALIVDKSKLVITVVSEALQHLNSLTQRNSHLRPAGSEDEIEVSCSTVRLISRHLIML